MSYLMMTVVTTVDASWIMIINAKGLFKSYCANSKCQSNGKSAEQASHQSLIFADLVDLWIVTPYFVSGIVLLVSIYRSS